MAENKNGFVLYKDLISVVKKLVLKDRENKTNYGGELFLLILEYVNDENPIAIDFILEITFEPIKQQLKRDLKKYEKTITKKSESGRIGNLKKWHLDIYKDYERGHLTLEEAEILAKNRKSSHCDKNIANITDTETEIVTDTVTVNDILLEKETKEEKLKKENSENDFDSETVKPETSQKEKSCAKKEKVKPPDLETFLDAGREIYQNELKLDFSLYEFALRAKYESWLDAGWKDGHKKPILTWKTKLRNIIPFLKPIYGKSNSNNANNSTTTQNGNSYGGSKVSGKVSASSILAREARKQFAGDCHSGNQTT